MTTSNLNDLSIQEDITAQINAAITAGQTLLNVDVAAALSGAATPSALNVFATIADVPVVSMDQVAAIQGANTPSAANVFMTALDGNLWLGVLADITAVEAQFVTQRGRASHEGDFAAATLTAPGGRHLLFATAAATWIAVLLLVAEP